MYFCDNVNFVKLGRGPRQRELKDRHVWKHYLPRVPAYVVGKTNMITIAKVEPTNSKNYLTPENVD